MSYLSIIYNRCKRARWHRPTARTVRLIAAVCLLVIGICTADSQGQRQKSYGSEQLGKALEYFTTGKYREALLIFEPLDAEYNLNSRFRAYMGVCYFYVWDFKKACEYLDSVMPEIEVYAPHERNVYYHTDAESHFNLGEYEEAIPLYEKQLAVCYDNEKADAFYRMGFCYLLTDDWPNAYDFFTSALTYYERYLADNPDLQARMIQIRNMLPGILKKLDKDDLVYYTEPVDTLVADSILADTNMITSVTTAILAIDIDSISIDFKP